MKKIIFKGCGTAIVTPFTKNGVDFDEFRNWMESLIGKPDLNQKEFLIELMNQKKAKWSTACVNITKEDICFIVHSSL